MKWLIRNLWSACAGLCCLLLLMACNKRLQCATYREVETVSVAEGDYDPTANGYIRVKRSTATNLVKKKKLSKKKAKRSRQMQTDKDFKKDPSLFYDKKDKNVKRQKVKSKKTKEEDCVDPPCPQGRK
ncbi:MAG: hypothetical protein KatS3mg033_0722 [Thermonema sp.]|uniref:DUF3221 domain-containing protein n=1 Tax=Thermonema TaxID=28194 RepID=UPI0012F82A35|nr:MULTISPECIES: DUF3221 domain-containing protein [Thermonema]GIV38922.1 MAG: hypothetical protein KatS3mg033_0722 [Thermonema sp.]